jgi:hypothetical protein
MRLAIIKNNIVENVIAIDDATKISTIAHCETQGYLCVVTDLASPGWTYDGNTFTQPEPVIQEEVPPVRISTISKLDYMDRFTDAELAGIYTAAKQFVQIEVWLEKFKLATHIDLDDPRTVSGVHSLEAAGLIGQGRAAEILA